MIDFGRACICLLYRARKVEGVSFLIQTWGMGCFLLLLVHTFGIANKLNYHSYQIWQVWRICDVWMMRLELVALYCSLWANRLVVTRFHHKKNDWLITIFRRPTSLIEDPSFKATQWRIRPAEPSRRWWGREAIPDPSRVFRRVGGGGLRSWPSRGLSITLRLEYTSKSSFR